MTCRDGPSFLTGVLALWMAKPLLDGVPSLDLLMEEWMLCLVPVVTTEAHLAFSGARTLSKNTEMTAMIEAFIFPWAPKAQLPRVFMRTPSMLLVFAWARSKLARTYS